MPGSREDLGKNSFALHALYAWPHLRAPTMNLHLLPDNCLPLRLRGHEIYNFLFPHPKDAAYQIW